MSKPTADLYDTHSDLVQVAQPIFRDFGGRPHFHGPVFTLKVFEDNSLVRKTLETAGENRVLIVDGGGSLRCALLGDQLGELAVNNGWAGIIVNGCVRDSRVLSGMDLGVKALATNPRKSLKRGVGESDVLIIFAGVTVHSGDYVYADEDGILISSQPLD